MKKRTHWWIISDTSGFGIIAWEKLFYTRKTAREHKKDYCYGRTWKVIKVVPEVKK